ncbi:MAG: ATP-dependent acyl-CoA ligase [Burkholderiales bacterium]|nr:MAG: ATP-dependent acyl-CoA ligase [Burkholderiales bacterium]
MLLPQPADATVFHAFRRVATANPERPFLSILPEVAARYGIEPIELSYGRALDAVEAIAARIGAAGYGHGHRAGLLLENRPSFFLTWLALNALGVSVVPINGELRAAELDYLVAHSGLCLAVVLPGRVADVAAAAARTGSEVCVVPSLDDEVAAGLAVSGADSAPRGLAQLLRAAAPPPLHGAPGIDTECGLLYTSGTTGRPKGCVLPNAYYLIAGEWYLGAGGLCAIRPGEDRLLTPLPMTHMNAMAYSTMAMVLSAGCVVPLDRFHPGGWWDAVRASRATIVHYLGVMPAMLLGAPASPADREHRVRFGFGAGVDRRHQSSFEDRFGFPLLEAWAMTETGAGAVVIANHEPRHVGQSCFGRAEPALELRLVDEAGVDVPDGTPGELLVRAAGADPRRGFFREYLKDAAATAEAWAGGWFHTGDVVRRDADGHLYFIDRRKNVIRRSGENIAAVEVESVLRRHPGVREVAVAATPDAVRGDEVLACVVPVAPLDDGARAVLAGELVALCLEHLAYFKAPGWVAFLAALPLTPTQKVQRGELKALAATLPGTAGCIDTRALKKRPH